MIKKVYKYEQKKERIKDIFEKPTEGDFIIISQLTSIKARKYDQLKKYGIEKKIKIEYLNKKKMKSVFEKDQEILQRLNNEIVIIKGQNYGRELKELITYLESEDINNKGILLLTILIAEEGKYREMAIADFKKKEIKVETKEEGMIELYKMLSGKVIGMGLKIINALKNKKENVKETC